jgi:hypothetical protein
MQSSAYLTGSQAWGDTAGARICQLVTESNTGAAQSLIEGRTDMLELMNLEELQEPDDIGLKLTYLCVFYDQPEILKYLHKRGVNFNVACDPMNFGTPLYYAITMSRLRIVETLDEIGVSLLDPCDGLGQLPMTVAERYDDKAMVDLLDVLINRSFRAVELIIKNFLRSKQRRIYLAKVAGAKRLNRVARGMLARKHVKRKREKQQDELLMNME